MFMVEFLENRTMSIPAPLPHGPAPKGLPLKDYRIGGGPVEKKNYGKKLSRSRVSEVEIDFRTRRDNGDQRE